jgi:hypothetical protein
MLPPAVEVRDGLIRLSLTFLARLMGTANRDTCNNITNRWGRSATSG